MNHKLWEQIIQNGAFHTMASPYGIKIFFFGQTIMVNNIKEMKPRLSLFSDRYPHSCRARMQLMMSKPFFSIISQAYVDYEGYRIQGEDVEVDVMYGDVLRTTPNPNYNT